MQVAEEKKNIIIDEAGAEGSEAIPAGLDRLDLILEADAKRGAGGSEAAIAEIKQRLDNIDAMIAYIMNTLDDDDLDYDDPDPYVAEALGDEDIDDPLVEDVPDYEDPDAVDVNPGIDHLNDDPYADIDIPPPEGWEGADLEVLAGLDVNREYWRTVDDFPDYEVSNHGRVRFARTRRVRKLKTNHTGYKYLNLRRNDGKEATAYIHRLVARAWIPNPEDKPQVDHMDGDKGNNVVQNLRWCTRDENMQNRGRQRNNTTGYKGVDMKGGRYRARIAVNGGRIHLGYFDTAAEAGAAYRAAALRYHGAYANPG